MKMMFIGDIVGSRGRKAVMELVPELRRKHNLSLVIANAENSAAGSGITANIARELSKVVDVITTGISQDADGKFLTTRQAATSPLSHCRGSCLCANAPSLHSSRFRRSLTLYR